MKQLASLFRSILEYNKEAKIPLMAYNIFLEQLLQNSDYNLAGIVIVRTHPIKSTKIKSDFGT